jgi:myosin heavy subunit
MEAESEQKQEIQKGQRLWEKQELVRAVADKRQQASGGLQKSMELEDERKETMLKEAKAERRRLRDGAFYRQQDLRMQIDTIKDINVQLQNKILAMATEHESAQQNLKFQAKLSEDNLEVKRNETDTIKDDFEKIAQQIREAQQHTLEAKDATAVHDQDEEKHLADISAVHRNVADMDREFHHLFQVEKTREDYSRALWHEHEDYLHSVQIAVDQAKYNMEEIRGAETRTQQEMQRCRKAMEKMAEVRNAFSHRKSIFRNKQLEHLRDTEHTFQRHHNGLREQLAALSALNPDNFFKISQVTNNAISDALQNVEKIKHDYAAARARVDAEHTPWGGEMQTAHQHPFLTHQYRTRDMQESDLRHGMQPEAFAASGGYSGPSSYTDQLVARSGGEAMASQNSRAIFPTPVSAGFSSHSPASQPQGRANDDTVGLNGPITNTQLFYPPSESMRASFTSGNAHSIESTPALMSAPSPSPMQRSAPPPMGVRNSNQDFPRGCRFVYACVSVCLCVSVSVCARARPFASGVN